MKSKAGTQDPDGDGIADDNVLEVTMETTSTIAPPFCVERGDHKYCRINQDHECHSTDVNMTDSLPEGKDAAEDCGDVVKNGGGKYFVVGTSTNKGLCWQEQIETDVNDCYKNQDAASCCPDTYKRSDYDFWVIVPVNASSEPGGALRSHGLLSFSAAAVMGLSYMRA